MNLTITINPEGTMEFIHQDCLVSLYDEGEVTIRRASNVEPAGLVQGKPGWTAEIIDGPTLGPFPTRQQALDAEVKWLEQNRL